MSQNTLIWERVHARFGLCRYAGVLSKMTFTGSKYPQTSNLNLETELLLQTKLRKTVAPHRLHTLLQGGSGVAFLLGDMGLATSKSFICGIFQSNMPYNL